MGTTLNGREPVLVQRLQGLYCGSDRAAGPHRGWSAQDRARARGGRRMGEGPVTEPARRRRPSWKLKPPHDARTQGVVVSGFGKLPSAQALFLFDDGAAEARRV